MKASEIAADKELQELLKDKITVVTDNGPAVVEVYRDGDRPTAGVADDFVQIEYNGPVESVTEDMGMLRGDLMVTLYCKMFSDGTVKLNRINKILEQFELLVNRQQTEHYFYKFIFGSFITPTIGNLDSGYSLTTFNVQWRTK